MFTALNSYKHNLSQYMKYVLAFLVLTGTFTFINAQSDRVYSIENLDVDIEVNKDSSFKVTETLSYHFDGEFNGMFREITLSDEDALQRCRANAALQCGGFELIDIEKVMVDGKEVGTDRYETMNVTSGGEDRLRVQYKFGDGPVQLTNESHTFAVTYNVFGGIGFFPKDKYALFYWDAIFPDRDVAIKKAQVKITYPTDVLVDEANLNVLSTGEIEYDFSQPKKNTTIYSVKDVAPYHDFTILQKLDINSLTVPGSIKIENTPDPINISFGDFKFEDVASGTTLKGMPAGKYDFTFSGNDLLYKPTSLQVTVESNKVTPIKVVLEDTLLGQIVTFVIAAINLICLLVACLAPIGVIFLWYTTGRDHDNPKAVIPEFNPPKGVAPYLLGSLKDEQVDSVDVSASIIDLAFRGFIIIKSEEKSGILMSSTEFTLEKTPKDIVELDSIELDLYNSIFADGRSDVKLSELANEFYTDYERISGEIYSEMVDKGYFKENPNSVRQKWLGIGLALIFIGGGAGFFLIGFGIFTLICAAIIGGVSLIISSRFMPKKTELGAETLRQVRGFKMYLETAEKYTLQNLTPEMFEKYLSYAIVFGIESKWAEKFKDIYTKAPDWYQSNSGNFNTVMLANSLSSFNRTASSDMTSRPSSSGSSSGSGWSGGGGFSGGFSGGGGGGGGGGAW